MISLIKWEDSFLTSIGIVDKQHRELTDLLLNWLAFHILGIDQSMARQIQSINKGLSPEETVN